MEAVITNIVNNYMAAIEEKDAFALLNYIHRTAAQLNGANPHVPELNGCFIDMTVPGDAFDILSGIFDGPLEDIGIAYSNRKTEVDVKAYTAQATQTVTVLKKLPFWDFLGTQYTDKAPPGHQPDENVLEVVQQANAAIASGEASKEEVAELFASFDESFGAGTTAAIIDGTYKFPQDPAIVACLKVKVTLEMSPEEPDFWKISKQTEEVLDDMTGLQQGLEADIDRVKAVFR